MDVYTLPGPDGADVPILAEWHVSYRGESEGRRVLYRRGRDIFYVEDLRGAGEEIADRGVPVSKDEILVIYEPTMLQCEYPDEVLDYVKMAPLALYYPGDTSARDCFANELTVYERLRIQPHPGICKYKGCIVVDGYVEGIVLERYRCSLKDAVEEGVSLNKTQVLNMVTDAVAHLHSLGLVHNDLGPHNILLDDNLQPVLIDMETCMPEASPPILKIGTPAWSGNWETSAMVNDEIALRRIGLYLDGLYNPTEE
jgi:hypothetical protein